MPGPPPIANVLGHGSEVAEKLAKPAGSSAPIVARSGGRLAQDQKSGGVLGAIGKGMHALTSAEQWLTAPLGAIPFPSVYALRVFDVTAGLPHGHPHPPTFGVPSPSIGPVLPIPWVSGASKVFINGRKAARCGDMGFGAWCGGYFPIFEVFTGSANVWIESARAGRMFVDVTKHCLFTPAPKIPPKPSDPPVGPMFGFTMIGSENVRIGGIPLPSLTNLAIGAAFKGLFKGAGAALRKLKASVIAGKLRDRAIDRLVNRLLGPNAKVVGSRAFRTAVVRDLLRIAKTPNQQILNRLKQAGKGLTIRSPRSSWKSFWSHRKYGPHCASGSGGSKVAVLDPGGPFVVSGKKSPKNPYAGQAASVTGDGPGAASTVVYEPRSWPNKGAPGSPSDVIGAHELEHAANAAEGKGMSHLADPDPAWQKKYPNLEEADAVAAENVQRANTPSTSANGGPVPQRPDYNSGIP